MKIFFLLLILSLSVFALTDEERRERLAREKVLNEFSDRQKFEAAEKEELAEQKKIEQEQLKQQQIQQQNLEQLAKEQLAQIQPNSAAKEQAAPPKSMDADDTADLEALSANKFSMPSMKDMPSIDPAKLESIVKNLDKNPMFKMMDKKQKEAAAMMMTHNPFQNMKRDAIKSGIKSTFDEGKPIGKFIHNSPKLLNIIADVGTDKDALPAFMSIMNKPGKLKTFGIIVLVVFVTVFFLNLKNSKSNILSRIMFKLAMTLAAFTTNIVAFYIVFQDEVGPTIDIIQKNL